MTEDQLEQAPIGWLQDLGYTHRYGPDIAHDGPTPERGSYREALLTARLRAAIARLSPGVPAAAQEDAARQVIGLGVPALLSANLQFHRLLVNGVPVQYQMEGETRGDLVKLIDCSEPARNEWWAACQFIAFARWCAADAPSRALDGAQTAASSGGTAHLQVNAERCSSSLLMLRRNRLRSLGLYPSCVPQTSRRVVRAKLSWCPRVSLGRRPLRRGLNGQRVPRQGAHPRAPGRT